MNKQQIILITAGVALVGVLFFGMTNVGPKKPASPETTHQPGDGHNHGFNLDEYKKAITAKLSPAQQQYVAGLEASVKRGDVKDQAVHIDHQLARFWKDTVGDPILHFYYASTAAELDNTEKSLTFAAQSILAYLPYTGQREARTWLAGTARSLFEKALEINPDNDSSNVGLGGTIIYGGSKPGDNPMEGIQRVLKVAQKDSSNMFAQYMLGVGGQMSGQLDKAVLRFERVAKAQPNNLEVLFKLAETYETLGDKPNAVKWYKAINQQVSRPDMKKELQARIDMLSK